MIERGQGALGAAYVLGSVAGALAGVFAGMSFGRLISR